MKWPGFIVLLLGLPLLAFAGDPAGKADAIFGRAAKTADVNLEQGRELYRVAALQYLQAAQAQPRARGPLLYNAGNAFFLAGEAGRAVVAYRQAERVMPGSRLLQANLAFVRKQSGNATATPGWGQWGRLGFWRWSPAAQWLFLAGAWLALWTALFQRQWGRHRWPRSVPALALAVTVLMAGTMSLQQIQEAHRCRGVIVGMPVVPRKGPNYGYAPAFTAAFDPGMECEVIGSDGDWLHVRFDADREGWLRRTAVEIWQGSPK